MKRIFFIVIFVLTANCAFAQQDSVKADTTATIKPQDITVEGELILNLPDMNKIKIETPSEKHLLEPPKQTYSINSVPLKIKSEAKKIGRINLPEEKFPNPKGNELKAGMGKFTTPELQLILNSRQSKTSDIGLELKHLSSQGHLKYASFSDDKLNLHGKFLMGDNYFQSRIKVSDYYFHYYAGKDSLDIPQSDIENNWFSLHAENEFGTNRPNGKVQFKGGLKANYIRDIFQNGNNEFGLSPYVNLDAKLDEEIHFTFHASDIYSQTRILSQNNNRNLLQFLPALEWKQKWLSARLGLNSFVNAEEKTSVHFYPQSELQAALIKNYLMAFTAVSGQITHFGLMKAAKENPYLDNDLTFFNSNQKILVEGGFRGSWDANSSFQVSVNYQQVETMPFYFALTDDTLNNKFHIVYFTSTNILGIHTSLRYEWNQKFQMNFSAGWRNFQISDTSSFSNSIEPWHVPLFDANLFATYKLTSKLEIHSEFILISQRYVPTAILLTEPVYRSKKLNPFVDISLGAEYKISKKISIFADGNNLLNQEYIRWNNYKERPLDFMIGAIFNF